MGATTTYALITATWAQREILSIKKICSWVYVYVYCHFVKEVVVMKISHFATSNTHQVCEADWYDITKATVKRLII